MTDSVGQTPATKPDIPLPGTTLALHPHPEWREGPLPPRLLLAEVPIHASYVQTWGTEGVPAETICEGQRNLPGKFLRSYLMGCLRFWLSSEATITSDGTIHYRQTRRSAAITLTPDTSSGVLLSSPEQQVAADAYVVTGHGRDPQIWSQAAVRDAVTHATKPGPADWPAGWALVMPSGALRFQPVTAPWPLVVRTYTAEPTAPPADWGPRCDHCGRFEPEHDPKYTWGRTCWDFQHPADD